MLKAPLLFKTSRGHRVNPPVNRHLLLKGYGALHLSFALTLCDERSPENASCLW